MVPQFRLLEPQLYFWRGKKTQQQQRQTKNQTMTVQIASHVSDVRITNKNMQL